jgi:CBS domain-containing protein
MQVRELMTENVITIGPETPIKDVAEILVENRISGVPVCDIEGKPLGVVSEGDILYKEHDPTERHLGGPLGWIVDGSPNYTAYIKAEALSARKAMTAPAITIAPYESVAQAARLMCECGVNRLPVVEDGRIVGIVTRADLVRAFTSTDAEIERELKDDVLERTMWIDPARVQIAVNDGAVELTGLLQKRSDVELLVRLARQVPGVVSVDSSVRWQLDDGSRRGRRVLERRAG